MKTNLRNITFSFVFTFATQMVIAQTQRLVIIDCYTSYKNKGDNYKNLRNYDLAIQQYQAAKYCKINTKQKIELDSLIADIGKRRQLEVKRMIIKRY